MTRLTSDMLFDPSSALRTLDQRLMAVSGLNTLEIAARALACPFDEARDRLSTARAAVVPIGCGEGFISGFAQAVSKCLEHIGMESYVTSQTDVAGFGQALSDGVDMAFAADDDAFLTMNFKNSRVIDNSWATARGFSEALVASAEKRDNGLKEKEVMVLGLGPVGAYSARFLIEAGAAVSVFDIETEKVRRFIRDNAAARRISDPVEALKTVDYILDATPAGDIIDDDMIGARTIAACPGVPPGLTSTAQKKLREGFIHDNLFLGVTVMALASVCSVPV